MSTKVPIYLKRGSRKGKKEKLRDILSSDMISPPLGDFRHTIHIGSGGQSDSFGDISFLQGKFHLLPRGSAEPAAPEPFEFARAATMAGGEVAAVPSPLLKNAISLPALGGAQALTLPAAQAPPKPPRLHLDETAAAASPPRARATDLSLGDTAASPPRARATDLSLGDTVASPPRARATNLPLDEMATAPRAQATTPSLGDTTVSPPCAWATTPSLGDTAASPPCARATNGAASPLASHAGSLLSLHVDLGPSILDEVLQVMERHQAERGARPEILT
ncbi:cdc42 effector protein 2 [Catharus ustulatus]|nr:cdc42 effector protein 2 [Catharus ustulatus]XP_032939498.1 cdc42 effector protein 2 [Catharus ustulatus]